MANVGAPTKPKGSIRSGGREVKKQPVGVLMVFPVRG
jgi:hypothetical protein